MSEKGDKQGILTNLLIINVCIRESEWQFHNVFMTFESLQSI